MSAETGAPTRLLARRPLGRVRRRPVPSGWATRVTRPATTPAGNESSVFCVYSRSPRILRSLGQWSGLAGRPAPGLELCGMNTVGGGPACTASASPTAAFTSPPILPAISSAGGAGLHVARHIRRHQDLPGCQNCVAPDRTALLKLEAVPSRRQRLRRLRRSRRKAAQSRLPTHRR